MLSHHTILSPTLFRTHKLWCPFGLKEGQRCQQKHFPDHDFHRSYQHCWCISAPSLCWHSHQGSQDVSEPVNVSATTGPWKVLCCAQAATCLFPMKRQCRRSGARDGNPGATEDTIPKTWKTSLCPLVPTSAAISRKKYRKITDFQRHLTSTKTSDMLLPIILLFPVILWKVKTTKSGLTGQPLLLMTKPCSFCTLKGSLTTPDSLVFLPTSFLLQKQQSQ